MRPLEWLLCITMLPAIALVLMGRQPRGVLAFVILAVLLCHAVFEGVHWQLGPAYLAAIVLVIYAVAGSAVLGLSLPRWAAASVAIACIALIVAAAVASYIVPMFQLPEPTGKYAIGTRILYVVDPTRRDDGDGPGNASPTGRRELVAQAWYPSPRPGRFAWFHRATYRRRKETNLRSSYQSVIKTHALLDAPVDAEGAPFPVLLFSPAWTGQRTQSTFLMEELASHGFVVVSVDHTYYSGLVELPGGRVFDASRAPVIGNFDGSSLAEQNARGDKFTRIEAQDLIAVLNALAAGNQDAESPFSARLDMNSVGALGHSIGGAAAAQACYMDARIKAALDMDGWLFADPFHHGLAKPFLRMIGTPEVRPSDRELAASPSLALYWQRNELDDAAIFGTLRRNGGYGFAINGLNHSSFTDRPLYSRIANQQLVPPARAYRIIDAYVLAFFRHTLRGADEPLLRQNPSPYPEVAIEVWPVPASSHLP